MKNKLAKMLKVKEEARSVLVGQSEKSADVAELRSINLQITGLNSEIAELRGLIGELAEQESEGEQEERTIVINGQGNDLEERSFQPGKGFKKLEGTNFERSKEELNVAEREKRGKELKEGRAVTVGTSSVVLPQQTSSTINGTFNKVSSLVDGVDRLVINGGEAYKQPYEKDTPAGDYTDEGGAAANTDTVFGYANIAKSKITAYSEITKEVTKLPAADYESVVMGGISKSARRKLAREILIGDGATDHLAGVFSTAATAIEASTDLPIASISNTTLNDIIFSYGGDEEVEDQAVLILNKVDLKAFSQLRNTNGSKFHTIVTTGNSGTIDGIPYIINSACKAISATATTVGSYAMAYGSLSNYKMVIFSELEVQRSTDYKFKEGMIAHRGEVYAGGNVVAHNGFLRIKKAAAV